MSELLKDKMNEETLLLRGQRASLIWWQQKQSIVNSAMYNTFTGRITNGKARERSEDTEKRSAFDSFCVFLNENDECQYSLAELEDQMNEEGKTTYSRKRLKEKRLARHFHHNRFS